MTRYGKAARPLAWGTLALSLALATRASAALNDDVAQATVLPPTGSASTAILTTATTAAGDPSCGAPVYQTVWYRYTSPVDQAIEAHLGDTTGSTGLRPRLAVYSGAPGALVAVECDPDAHAVEFDATSGTTYYFMLSSPSPAGETTLNFNVNPHAFVNPDSAIPPLNDFFWYALPVTPYPFVTTADVGAATGYANYDPPICGDSTSGYVLGDSLWYTFTAPTGGEVDVLFSSAFDAPYVGVFTGGLDGLSFVACSARGKWKTGATRFTAAAGTTYSLEFASSYEHLDSMPAVLAVRPAPAPTGGAVTVSPNARLYRRFVCVPDVGCSWETHVVVGLHVTCAAPIPSVHLDFTVTHGASSVTGSGQTSCATGAGFVAIDKNYAPSGFRNGAATVTANASDFDENYYVSSTPTTVKLGRKAPTATAAESGR